ncbi:MAG: hypothetical protein IKO07_05205 [Clostridia bacterium]|nr:hypothetical protein [Clostridia bacterium]
MKIEDWLDCQHTVRVLGKAGITEMEELAKLSRGDLLKLRGIGPVIAGDVEKRIEEWNSRKNQGIQNS